VGQIDQLLLAFNSMPGQSTPIEILHPFDLIEGPLIIPLGAHGIDHRASAIRSEAVNPVPVSVAIFPECDPDEIDQLVEVSFDPVLEFALNGLPQGVILPVTNLPLIEYVDDVLVEKIATRIRKIESFIFKEGFPSSR
jgi:hypothetical protein